MYDYVEGSADQHCYTSILDCQGCFWGSLKAFIPVFGCFICCVQTPYRIVQQGYSGIIERFGKKQTVVKAGLTYVNPVTQSINFIDERVQVIDLNSQSVITKDYIVLRIDAAVYYEIINPIFAQYRVNNLHEAILQLTHAILKNTVGKFTFQQILQKRDEVTKDIEQQVDKVVQKWGVNIKNIYFKDFSINKSLQSQLNAIPIAKCSAQSKILVAKGNAQAALLIRKSAQIMNSKVAMQMRYLNTLQVLISKSRVLYVP